MTPSTVMLLGIAACAFFIVLVVFRSKPQLGFAAWCLALFFVPIWVGASVGIFVSAITAVTVVTVLASRPRLRAHWGDLLIGAFAAVVLIMFGLGMVSVSHTFTALVEYTLPYIWGRIVLGRLDPTRVSAWIAGCAAVAAVLALLEFASGTNPFVLLPGSGALHEAWSGLQARGGVLRVEGAFGHSIALGASLSMASAFIYSTRWRALAKFTALGLIGAAVVLTFSRIGLVSFSLTTVLCLVLMREIRPRLRVAISVVCVAAALAVAPLIGGVLTAAGDEAAGSADYRGSLLALLPQAQLIGAAGDWQTLVAGDTYLGMFSKSIDNTVILMLLRYGIIPTALPLLGVVGLVVMALVKRPANPAALAIVSQVPSFVTVALITQYGVFVWFLAGLAVGWSQFQRETVAQAPLSTVLLPQPERRPSSAHTKVVL